MPRAKRVPASRLRGIASALLPSLLLAGGTLVATVHPADAATPTQPGTPTGIHWHYGDLDGALAIARRENKPVFLYWGADWCPPCNDVKETIFSRREFIDRSRLFVPVYLDGDTAGAQKAGARFGVWGYPTMIVLAPDGTEITRIPGGIDPQRYIEVLTLAAARVQPVKRIVAEVLANRERRLTPHEARLLAYYSWEQDNERVLAEDAPATLARLYEACPAEAAYTDCSRLFVAGLLLRAAAGKPAWSATERAAAARTMKAVLADPALTAVNVEAVTYDTARLLRLLSDEDSEARRSLAAAWREALDALETSGGLSVSERLYATLARIRLFQLTHPETDLPAALRERAKQAAASADEQSRSRHARQSVIGTAAYLLDTAGYTEAAKSMLLAELDRSDAPYYFMSSLASIAREQGRDEDALRWLQRAYDSARGPATRFQWGADYVAGLIDIAPADSARIEAAALSVVGELKDGDDAFWGRNAAGMGRLDRALRRWNGDGAHLPALKRIRTRVAAMCGGLPAGDAAYGHCRDFLAGL